MSGDATLVKLDHVGKGKQIGAVGDAHLALGVGERLAAHFAHALLHHLAVPLGGADIGGEKGEQAPVEIGFVSGGADDFDDRIGLDIEVEAKESVKALAEIALVGFGQLAREVFANLGEEARQVEEAGGAVGQVGRGQIVADFAGGLAVAEFGLRQGKMDAEEIISGSSRACV